MLPPSLFQLLKQVQPTDAVLMVMLSALSVTVSFINMQNTIAAASSMELFKKKTASCEAAALIKYKTIKPYPAAKLLRPGRAAKPNRCNAFLIRCLAPPFTHYYLKPGIPT